MSEIKVTFIFKDQKIDISTNNDDTVQNILSIFASKQNRNVDDFDYLNNGEKITNFETKKLSELNDKDNIINISVYEKNELNKNSNQQDKENLIVSNHIICPKCKNMGEIDIDNFKISITNCDNNHSTPELYMNDFINTQYIDESKIICNECKKTEKDLNNLNEIEINKLLLCSCGKIICQKCYQLHNEEKEKYQEENSKIHFSIEYRDKYFFCLDHNMIYTRYCHNCRKNICDICEKEHNKHRIEIFKKISPDKRFIKKLNDLNEEFIIKVQNFNNELNELINKINNISNNIQKNLRMLILIANKVIDDYNLTKINYQTIQNVKVVYNNLIDSPIIKSIDSFLENENSGSKINNLLDMYTKIYLESNNNLFLEEIVKTDNKDNINNIKKEKNNKIQETKNMNNEKKIILGKSKTNRYMILKYTPNMEKIKDNRIKLFGSKFYENNKNNCSLVISGNEYLLSEYYIFDKKDFNNNNELELKLKVINSLIDISYMFHSDANESPIYLSKITSISSWDTSKVINMSYLFSNCKLLTNIPDISKWDMSNVVNISNLFYNCVNIISLPNISKWKTDNINNMSYLFYNCKNLSSLPDISKWNTKKISDMRGIFCNCSSLKSLPDISKWNTENVNNMSLLFQHCTSLIKIPDISCWRLDNVNNIGGMFDHCTSLQSLPDISKWNIKNVTNLNYMFYFCTSLTSFPDISKWNTMNVITMKGLFCDCNSLSIIPDISKWNTSNVTNMGYMFYNCKSLLSLPDLIQWDTSKVKDIKYMFFNCDKLPKNVIPKKFDI